MESDYFNNCSKGFLSINGKQFCGCLSGLKLFTTFNRNDSISFSLNITNTETDGMGFAIEVIQEECLADTILDGKNIHRDSYDNIIEYNSPGKPLIQGLKLVNQDTQILNRVAQDISPSVTINTFYFFADETDNDIPDSFKTGRDALFTNLDNLEPITIINEIPNCQNTLLPNILQQYRDSTNFCVRNKKTENLLFFRKPIIRPSTNCVELDYLRGYFRSPFHPIFYPKFLNLCYR